MCDIQINSTNSTPFHVPNPQPAGWGLFIPAYKRDAAETLRIPQPAAGDRSFQPISGDETLAGPLAQSSIGNCNLVHIG